MFKSVLSEEMDSFLKLRKSSVSHSAFRQDNTALIAFDEFLIGLGCSEKTLTGDVFDAWIPTLRGKSKTIKGKVLSVRVFAKYLDTIGHSGVLPDVPRAKSNFIPYIFSDEEISQLMHLADNLQMKEHSPYSPHIELKIPMILRILYGCGTRIGETMALQRKDIDFKAGTIFLRTTKCSKERRIPMHESLVQILERYCLAIGIMQDPDAYLFPGKKQGQPCVSRCVQEWFSRLLELANIDQRAKEPGERGASLHCLRHVFVLKSMQQMEAAGHQVDLNDLLLPTYLYQSSIKGLKDLRGFLL
jgi:integrase